MTGRWTFLVYQGNNREQTQVTVTVRASSVGEARQKAVSASGITTQALTALLTFIED